MMLKYIIGGDDMDKPTSSSDPYYTIQTNSTPEIGEGIFLKGQFVGFVTAKYRVIDQDEVHIVVRPKRDNLKAPIEI